MKPEQELQVGLIADAFRLAGFGACVIWPHEEILEMSREAVVVYDSKTDSVLEKRLL